MLSLSSASNLLLSFGVLNAALVLGAPHLVERDGSSPSLTFDPNTTKYCSWWIDLTSEANCPSLLEENFITLEEFRRWNPSIGTGCSGLIIGKSYCVETMNEPAPTTSSSTSSSTLQTTSTSTSKPVVTTPSTTLVTSPSTTTSPTTTMPSNGVETPSPLQPEIAANCDAFYYVKTSENCESIARANGISTAQFLAWNPSAGSNCAGLWANAYACVSIIGHTPTSPSPSPTTTKGNGIATPTPIQDGMVSNCDSFYMVKSGDTCDKISSANGITSSQIISWNPAVGSNCGSLWLDTYICISTIGHTPTTTTKAPTTTRPTNGITTPTPYQEGMTASCKTFHLVASGDNCSTISAKYKISTANFIKWNPAAGSTCAGLWKDTYACVGVL